MTRTTPWKFLAIAAASTFAAPAKAAALTVVLGTSAAATGPRGPVGQDFNNGVILAVEDLNRQHLRIGGRDVAWKLIVEDDKGDPRQAAVVAQKFIDSKVAGVIGPDTSGASYATVRLFDAAGVPMIAAASTDTRLAHMGSKTFFRVIGDDAGVAAAMANYLESDLHVHTVATIDDRTAYGQGLADAFARAAKARGMRVVGREYTNDKATDFSAILTRLRGLQPEAIVYGGTFAQAAPLLRQVERLGLTSVVLGGDGACVQGLARMAGPAVRRMVCVDSGLPLERMPSGADWKRRYDSRFGAEAFQAYSPYAYDATMVLAQAILRAGSSDPAKFLPMLRSTDYSGISREHLRFLPNGNLAHPDVTISIYREGVKVPLRVQAEGS